MVKVLGPRIFVSLSPDDTRDYARVACNVPIRSDAFEEPFRAVRRAAITVAEFACDLTRHAYGNRFKQPPPIFYCGQQEFFNEVPFHSVHVLIAAHPWLR
jgi:hypothetical protein